MAVTRGSALATAAARRQRAARLRDYFDLQLRFAALLGERAGRPLAETVASHTNLHRRLGLGVIGAEPRAPAWRRYLDGLLEQADHAGRLAWTVACVERAADEQPPPGQHRFGCFAFDDPDSDGVVSLHFANLDRDGGSPLAAARRGRRQAELRALFTRVRREHPAAASVRGTSWLYNLEAYRRLFPPAYAASRRPPERPLHFHGSTLWGQFLDHRERVRPGPRDEFLANLADLDPARPAAVFPLPALLVTAPLALFYDFYGVD